MSIKKSLKSIKSGFTEKYQAFNDSVLYYQQQRYYVNLAKLKNISYEEAIELCKTDPECSLGLKLADPDNVALTLTKKGKENFKKKLTPEELEIFERDSDKNFKRALRKEKKKAKM